MSDNDTVHKIAERIQEQLSAQIDKELSMAGYLEEENHHWSKALYNDTTVAVYYRNRLMFLVGKVNVKQEYVEPIDQTCVTVNFDIKRYY